MKKNKKTEARKIKMKKHYIIRRGDPEFEELEKLLFKKLKKQQDMIKKDVAEKKRCYTCHKKFRKGDVEKNWCSWCCEQIEIN